MNANAPRFNSDAIDHTIDRALSALRDAQPRSGSEMFAGRILASLEHRAATPQPARFHLSAHVALWTAASAAVLAIASMMILHYRVVRAPQDAVILSERSESKDPDAADPATYSDTVSTTNLARISRDHYEPRLSQHTGWPIAPRCRCRALNPGAPLMTMAQHARHEWGNSTPSDAQLLADLHAPSHPAPPLPLTPQEKLFLRMLRYGNATAARRAESHGSRETGRRRNHRLQNLLPRSATSSDNHRRHRMNRTLKLFAAGALTLALASGCVRAKHRQ